MAAVAAAAVVMTVAMVMGMTVTVTAAVVAGEAQLRSSRGDLAIRRFGDSAERWHEGTAERCHATSGGGRHGDGLALAPA
jgi:hypothetical protein